MSAVCPHGFAPAECLICKTLGSTPQVQVEAKRSPPAPPGGPGAGSAKPATRGRAADQPDAVYLARSSEERPRSLSSYAALTLAGIAVLAVLAYFLAGAVFAILRVVELLAVAGLAGWAGYKWGHYRGRHHRDS